MTARWRAAVGLLSVAAGCTDARGEYDSGADDSDSPRRVATLGALRGPESVRYDPAQDVWFISNMNGGPSYRDGNGYILRASGADPTRTEVFVESGRDGVTLHAPKGLAISGDTLWVADLHAIHGFHTRTGALVASVDLTPVGPVFPNDVAIGPDGDVYFTDTGIIINEKGVLHPGPDRILKVGAGRQVSVVLRADSTSFPNGLTWDAAGARWIVLSFHPLYGAVQELKPGDTTLRKIASAPAKLDGVEILPDGRTLFTSWADSSLHVLADSGSERIITKMPQPADFGVDTRRGIVAVPLVMAERVEFWQLPHWRRSR